jgi:hypothetical protein
VINLILSCCVINYSTEAIWFGESSLEGMIPSEIGELTKLSEYAIIVASTRPGLWLILMVHF